MDGCWVWLGLAGLLDCRILLGYCTKLPKTVQTQEYCTKLHKIAQVLRARLTQGIAHLTIAITLLLIVSRKGWLTQPFLLHPHYSILYSQ